LFTTKYIKKKAKPPHVHEYCKKEHKVPYIYEYWLDLFIKEELLDLRQELDNILYKLRSELNSIVYSLKPELDKYIIVNYNILKNLPAGKMIIINNKSYVKLAANEYYYINDHFFEVDTGKIIHYSKLAEMCNEIIKI
jgi:hypothetical protein